MNRIYNEDCLEGLQRFEDNCFDCVVTDPPYFLIDKSGNGFMGNKWESLKNSNVFDILWKSRRFARSVENFLLRFKVEPNSVEVRSVLGNASTKCSPGDEEQSRGNVRCVKEKLNEPQAQSNHNMSSVRGIALTTEEVLAMLRDSLKNPKDVIESLNENAWFVIPHILIRKKVKSIVQEDALKWLIKKQCAEKTILLSLMAEAKIRNAIEEMIGQNAGEKSIKEIGGDAESVESIAGAKKYNAITLSHTERQAIMRWITSLLFATDAIPGVRGNLRNFLMQEFHQQWAEEVLRVLKPGGYLLAFGGTRTYHRLASGIEDAGFEIRDQIGWTYGGGFPKSLDVSKAIDKAAGVERKIIGFDPVVAKRTPGVNTNSYGDYKGQNDDITAPATDEAKQWDGWGTALKPAWEPIVVARKPLNGTVAENVLRWGTGGLNVDGCRIPTDEKLSFGSRKIGDGIKYNDISPERMTEGIQNNAGRFPANLIHDGSDEVLALFPKTTSGKPCGTKAGGQGNAYGEFGGGIPVTGIGDTGSAARFFYCAKASPAERGENNNHPTVKPIALMRYLVRLVCPPKGIVLEPYLGSGTTAIAALQEGMSFVGFEKKQEYADIARARIMPHLAQKRLC